MQGYTKKLCICRLLVWVTLLHLLDVLDGRSLIHGINKYTYVDVPDVAESVFFFSIQGTLDYSCGSAEIVFYTQLIPSGDDQFKLYLSNGNVDGHILIVHSSGSSIQRIEIRDDDQPRHDIMDLSCDHPKYFWVAVKDARVQFGWGNKVYENQLWRSNYFTRLEAVTRIKLSLAGDSDGPTYVMVPPFALPQFRSLNIEDGWTDSDLYQLYDLEFNGTSCIEVVPIEDKEWTLRIQVPLLSNYYDCNQMIATIKGDFLTCDDMSKLIVSVVNNDQILEGGSSSGPPYCDTDPTRNTICTFSSENSGEGDGMTTCHFICEADRFNELFIIFHGDWMPRFQLCEINYE